MDGIRRIGRELQASWAYQVTQLGNRVVEGIALLSLRIAPASCDSDRKFFTFFDLLFRSSAMYQHLVEVINGKLTFDSKQ